MQNDPMLPQDTLGIQGELREVTARGATWRIFEYVSPTVPRRAPVLVFYTMDGDFVFETVDYPKEWRALPGEDLLALARIS